MKILRFEAENVKRLRAVQITPRGNVVQITGANGSGKSSVLDAIYWALAGAAAVPARPVHDGAERAFVKLDLGEFTVTRRFTAGGGTSLVVEAATGAVFRSPQAMLDKLLGTLTFDPLAFSRMAPRAQRAELCKLTGLTAQLDTLAAADAQDAEARTAHGRTLKELQVRLHAMPAPAEVPAPVDVVELMDEIRRAEAANADGWREAERREQEAAKALAFERAAAERRERARQLSAQADEFETRAGAVRRALETAGELPGPIDVEPLRQRIVDAQRINALVDQASARTELASEVTREKEKVDTLARAMAAREETRAVVVRATPMPVEGLGVAPEGVTYRGLPLEQASSAEQLRVSVAIAMATNPRLRVLRIQDGSLLDERSLALLAEMADAQDYQVWVERVDTSGAVGIVMEDGAVAIDHTAADDHTATAAAAAGVA